MQHLLLAGYLSLFTADGVTTHIGLERGAHEVFQTSSPVINDGIITAQAVVFYQLTKRIERPWLRWTVRLGIAGIHGYAAVHNVHVIAQLQ